MTLTDKSTASVIRFMKERFDLDMTAEQVRGIAERQKIVAVINKYESIADTYEREYWLDAIAVEWAGREAWPCNNDGPQPTFATDLIAGYKRMREAT
jgi:hypothetical protein